MATPTLILDRQPAALHGRARRRLRRQRRGLAPFELVLALPLLLGLMALMVNFGTVASWKVRTLSVSRHEAFAARWPRAGGNSPRPEYWPTTAAQNVAGGAPLSALDDPRVDQPVVRGPQFYTANVNSDLLDPTLGSLIGEAGLQRRYPMLGSLGSYQLDAATELLDNRWEFQRFGLSRNRERRIPVLYELPLASAEQGYADRYMQAVLQIYYAAYSPDLAPLDKDDEFIFYGGGAPDFHPRLAPFCSIDSTVADGAVETLTWHIEGHDGPEGHTPSVAEVMAGAFVGLYTRAIQEIKNSYAPLPPPGAAQAQIDQLQQKIDTLNLFLQSL